MAQTRAGGRRPAGAAVPSERVTEAIRTATFALLAEVGFGRLSIEAVAERAGVSKTAIYRRWSSKQELVVGLVTPVAMTGLTVPDTGAFVTDLEAYLRAGRDVLSHPLVGVIAPDLLAEAARNPELSQSLVEALREPRRAQAAGLLDRAIDRGELPADTDVDLALDLVAGPLYWRLAVTHSEVSDDYLQRLVTALTRAFDAR
ncbi:TetR/AcrR family transcriptional regulator [Tsukamurella soli]|uniref:TetR/AcrR family transcriptional regulator n=1 Tax=Tsukamurella soli TaxID=644556 RepID=A0ABP8JAQ3_9ACTN